MPLMNQKRVMMFLVDGATLPVPPANFLELQEAFAVNPQTDVQEFERISGKMGSYDSYIDPHKVTFSETISHKMRTSDKAGTSLGTPPEYAQLLKVCGMKETIDTGTPSQETVIYTNTQAPTEGSAIIFLDDKKFTLTDTMTGDLTMTFEAGQAGVISSTLSGYYDNKGIPVDESNPSVTLSTEDCLICTKTDIITAGGVEVKADAIRLTMNAQVDDFYGFNNLAEFNITDYNIKLEADFYVDKANYASEMNKLVNQTVEAINVQMSTDDAGSLVSGKSVRLQAQFAKASDRQDSLDQNKVKRTFTWMLQLDSNAEAFSLEHGYFA